jgi:signal transducing adaptor molecule
MPLFGEPTSQYDDIVEKITAETLTEENWALFMDLSDRVNSDGVKGAKQCLLAIKKRLNHRDPHVVLFALSLLDCLWNNSSVFFRREVSSNEFINELTYKATNSNRYIAEKTRELIKKWTDNECKRDASLSLIESLYKDLLEDGYTFESVCFFLTKFI